MTISNDQSVFATIVEHYVDVGPFRTRLLLAGDENASATILLLHDGAWGGCSSVTWADVIPHLARNYRIIAPDMLGFGGTDKAVFVDRSPYDFRIEHLVALLDRLGVEGKVHVIGNSFGGSLALQMIPQRPERLASVTSISGTGGPWRSAFGRAELAKWDGTAADIRRICLLLCDETGAFDMEAQVAERFRWASMPGHYRAMAAPGVPQPEALQSGVKPDASWPEPLAHHDIPVMNIAGSKDALVDAGWMDYFTPHIRRYKTVVLDTRHSPNIDQPVETAALLAEWIASLD